MVEHFEEHGDSVWGCLFHCIVPGTYIIPTACCMMTGGYDVMAVPEDFSEVRRRLRPGVLVAHYQYPQYGHMDFVWDRNAKHLPDMADLFFRYSPGTF